MFVNFHLTCYKFYIGNNFHSENNNQVIGMKIQKYALGFILFNSFGYAMADNVTVYRWVDSNNVVHFSQHQPKHDNYTELSMSNVVKAKDDNINNTPVGSWRSHGSLLFTNWLNYYVYQMTPYHLDADHMNATLNKQ